MYCTLFYGVYKGPAYWNVMSSIFRAQLSSLPCYVGGKGLEVGGSMAHCLTDAANYESEKAKSNERQTMTQHWRRQSSKGMLLRELLQRWKGFPGEAALSWAFNNQDAGDDHEQLPSVQWDTGLSVTILKYHNPQGTSQLGWLLVFLIILIITEPLMSWK